MKSRIVQLGNSRRWCSNKPNSQVKLTWKPSQVGLRFVEAGDLAQGGRPRLEKSASRVKTVSLIRQRHKVRREGMEVAVERVVPARGEVYLVRLEPTPGSEIVSLWNCIPKLGKICWTCLTTSGSSIGF